MSFLRNLLNGAKNWLVSGIKMQSSLAATEPASSGNWQGDALCFVLAAERQVKLVYLMLDHFLPIHPPLTAEVDLSDEDAGREFADEVEMLTYFQDNPTKDATRYWYPRENNPADYMVGAHFTSDGHLLLSLTLPGNERDENQCLAQMKALLDSSIGLIWYNSFPEFRDGADFRQKYSDYFSATT